MRMQTDGEGEEETRGWPWLLNGNLRRPGTARVGWRQGRKTPPLLRPMFDICSPRRVFREISRAEGPSKQAGRPIAHSIEMAALQDQRVVPSFWRANRATGAARNRVRQQEDVGYSWS